MEIKVNYLDNLRLESKFDDFTVISDQPIRYKGDGSAPGPFDYFLASSAKTNTSSSGPQLSNCTLSVPALRYLPMSVIS